MSEWNKIQFGEFADFKNGINFEKNQKGALGIPTLDVKNMYSSGCYISTDDLYFVNKKIENDYYLQKGDLLFVRSSLKEQGVGWTSLYGGKSNSITFCGFIIRGRIKQDWKDEFDPEFLTYLFRTDILRRELVSGSGRVAITNINQGLLKTIRVPKPSISEQRKIAYILNTIQKAIEQQYKLIKTTTELKKALMQKLFTEGTKGEKQKQTEIGLVPESWEITKLVNLTHLITKGSSPKWQGFNYCQDGILFVRSQNIGWGVIENDFEYLPKEFNQIQKRSILRANDVLINLVGASIGRVAIAPEKFEGANSNQAVALVRLKGNKLNEKFLMYFLLTEVGQSIIKSNEKAIARANISLNDIANFKIPIAPLDEQLTIVNNITVADHKIQILIKKKQALTDLFKTLLHELMTGERRVHELEFEIVTKEYTIEQEPLSMVAEE